MKITFDPKDHTYHSESGRVVPGVNQIMLATGITEPYTGPPIYGERGTYVHAATELLDADDLDIEKAKAEAPDWWGYIEAYQTFRAENKIDILASEEIVSHEAMWYAGRLDRRLMLNGDRTIVDIKTSSCPAPWHVVQTVAYRETFPRTDGYKCRVLYLRQDGTYRLCGNAKEQEEAMVTWRNAMARWREMYPWSRPD